MKWTTFWELLKIHVFSKIYELKGGGGILRQYPALQGPKKVFFANFFSKGKQQLSLVKF